MSEGLTPQPHTENVPLMEMFELMPHMKKAADNVYQQLREWGYAFGTKQTGQSVLFKIDSNQFENATFEHLVHICREPSVSLNFDSDTKIITIAPMAN